MTTKKVNTHVSVIFQKIKQYESVDSRFLKVKIWLMHTGENLNGSSFSKDVVDKAIPTLANTPILAFMEENSAGDMDFSDHRIVLHRNEDGEFKFKYLGSAVGVIPENNNAHWEMRVTDTGEEKEYLVVDALMWTKWGDPTDIMSQKGWTSQSMELADNYSGNFDENGIFHFDSFSFFGACLLGADVIPAMQNSSVEVDFSQNDTLQNTIESKLQEFYKLSQEGGNEAMEIKDDELNVELEATQTVEEISAVDENNTNLVFTNDVFTNDDLVGEATIAPINTTGITLKSQDFTLTSIQTEQTETVAQLDAVDLETATDSQEFTLLSQEIETLKQELEVLRSYKRLREESDIKAKFADKLSEEEFASVFESMKDADIQDVEDKLFALYGKKNFSIKSSNTVTETNKVVLAQNKEEEFTETPYGGLFEKYKTK